MNSTTGADLTALAMPACVASSSPNDVSAVASFLRSVGLYEVRGVAEKERIALRTVAEHAEGRGSWGTGEDVLICLGRNAALRRV
jgi:hypothetical protein